MSLSVEMLRVIMPLLLLLSNLTGIFSFKELTNQNPVANNDFYTLNLNSQLLISAPGVLGNDSAATQRLTVVIKVSAPTHGSLSLNKDGSFTYIPQVNYSGSDSFSYRFNDGQSYSNAATVFLTIYPVNDLAGKAGSTSENNNQVGPINPQYFGINVAPLAPINGTTEVATSPSLIVNVTDANNSNLQVSFYGRQKINQPASNFTIAVIPDTQFYTVNTGGNFYFNAETAWIANNQTAQNIVFTTHTGDITQNGENDTDDSEWRIADTAISFLERNPADTTDDVPFSVSPGNHDSLGAVNGVLTHYDAHFASSRFSSKPYYGGHYGTNNDNSYSIFSAGGMHFIVLNLACTSSFPSTEVLAWAGGLLKDDVSRRGIVVCHNAMEADGSFSSTGQLVYNTLRDNPNWFLLLAGHAGNKYRTDQAIDGHSITSIEADYEGYSNGGNGYIRLLQFQPGNNQIQVYTYSPTINGGTGGYNTAPDSQFSIAYPMRSPDFTLISTVTVPSGMNASAIWYGLANNTQYEWYAVARNATYNSASSVQSFTTTSSPSGTETPTLTPTLGPPPPTPTATATPTYPPNVFFQDDFDPVSESWTHYAAIGTDDWVLHTLTPTPLPHLSMLASQ
jgi:hypothetical protein